MPYRIEVRAEALLVGVPQAVLAGDSPLYDWKNETDRTLADKYRLRVLELLEKGN